MMHTKFRGDRPIGSGEDFKGFYNHTKTRKKGYTAIFHGCKNANFQLNCFNYFHIFAQNIYLGYTLKPPY